MNKTFIRDMKTMRKMTTCDIWIYKSTHTNERAFLISREADVELKLSF